jgi:hypothetical protein
VENRYNQAYQSAKRSETNTAPTDTDTNIFIKLFTSEWATGTFYLELQNSAGTAIGTRMLGTAFADVSRNTVNYHAEFEAGNGTTTDVSTTYVAKVALFRNLTGGAAIETVTLGSSYYTPKWTGTRILVDFATWDGT